MKGYVSATKGCRVSERQLKLFLPAIAPVGHYARQTSSLERSNPAVYSARCFGHKMHIDQNEKLIHFGVTYVMARDGFSGKIVSGAVMPCNNNLIIYEDVYMAAVLGLGSVGPIRVDYGREFCFNPLCSRETPYWTWEYICFPRIPEQLQRATTL